MRRSGDISTIFVRKRPIDAGHCSLNRGILLAN
jgi:hypothetical protein